MNVMPASSSALGERRRSRPGSRSRGARPRRRTPRMTSMQLVDLEVGLGGRPGAEQVGLVGALDVLRVAVGLGVDGDRGDARARRSARMTRTAISPRLATRTLLNMAAAWYWELLPFVVARAGAPRSGATLRRMLRVVLAALWARRCCCGRASSTAATGSTRRSRSGSPRTASARSRGCCGSTAPRRCSTCCCTAGWRSPGRARPPPGRCRCCSRCWPCRCRGGRGARPSGAARARSPRRARPAARS